MRNMYHILRQAVMVLSVLFLVTSSGETLAQNGWQQQIQNAQKAQLADEVTEDGRALGKFQNRIFAVPAARLGITPRDTSTSPAALATSWSPQKQSAINADIEKLASGASSGSGTAGKGESVKVASVPTPGGGTQRMSVQEQTMDRSHPGQAHWEAGRVKTDPRTGAVRENNYGRPALTNDKSKVDY